MMDRPPMSNDHKPVVDVQLEYDDVKAKISLGISTRELPLFFFFF